MTGYSIGFNRARQIYQIWYTEPLTGKRLAKTLYITDKKGKKQPATTKEEAEKAAKKFIVDNAGILSIENEQQAMEKIADKKRELAGMTVKPEDLLKRYMDSVAYNAEICDGRKKHIEMVMGKFTEYCVEKGIAKATDISPAVVSSFIADTCGNLSHKTQNEYLAVVRQIFEAQYKELGLLYNPASSVRRKSRECIRREALTEEQYKALLDGFKDGFTMEDGKEWKPKQGAEYRLVAFFGGQCGARLADACGMTWANVDLDKAEVHWYPHKTRKSTGVRVSVPIVDPEFISALKEARAQDDGKYVTPNLAKQYEHDKAAVSSLFSRAFAVVCGEATPESDTVRARRASIYGFHSLRHSFASFCANHGVPATVAGSILGHASVAMTQHYTHISDEAKREALSGVFSPSLRDKVLIAIKTADDRQIQAIAKLLDI